MVDLARRYERYAAKWLAETENYEPPRYRETTDENLAEVLSHQWVTIPAKADEYPAIREAIDKLREELRQHPGERCADCEADRDHCWCSDGFNPTSNA